MREMKDSGIEWIGDIPADWGTRKNKYLLDSMYSGGTPSAGNSDFYAVDSGIPFVSISDMSSTDYVRTTKKALTEEGRADKNLEILPIGTILYSIYATVGAVSELAIEATISQAMLALDLKSTVDKQYYKYCLCSMKDYIFGTANGNTQFNLNAEKVWNFEFPFPTIDEQQRISYYLDQRCAEIDAVIERTKATIEEYKKLKQSIITEAVTKGISADSEMRETEYEWICNIPSHWKTIKVKWLLSERKERSEEGREEPLSMSQKLGLIPTKEMDMIPNMASSFVGAKLVYVGDLVFNKLKAHLGVFAVSRYDGLVSPDYAVYYPTGLANVKYLEYLFKTPQYIAEFRKKSSGVGAGLTRLYTDDLFSIYCSLPPMEEQAGIIAYLDKKCAEMDTLIARKTALLAEMEVYKKSVIYEYVTGKKEVV